MEQNPQNNFRNIPQSSADFGSVPNVAEGFRTVPNDSESFGSLPHDSESFRNMPQPAAARDKYTLSVREVARMFEAAGVARSERSIINWCQRNTQGVGKLDAYFDPNERKYFITPESVDLAIAEEKAKAATHGHAAEDFSKVPSQAEAPQVAAATEKPTDLGELKTLEAELLDLKITNRGKDFFIQQLKDDREGFVRERQQYVEKLMSFTRKVGELETRLLQLNAPIASAAEEDFHKKGNSLELPNQETAEFRSQ